MPSSGGMQAKAFPAFRSEMAVGGAGDSRALDREPHAEIGALGFQHGIGD